MLPPGIPSPEEIAAGELAANASPPGIPSNEEVVAGQLGANVAPPGIPSPEEIAAGELAANASPPGIPSNEEVAAGALAANASPPGIPSPEEIAPGDTTAGIHPPGIPSSEEDGPGKLEGNVLPPGIPANDVTAPGEVAPAPPPAAAHGGPAGWWKQKKWDEIRAEANGWWAKTDIDVKENTSYQEVYAYGFPTDASDDNVYAIPLRSFQVAEDTATPEMQQYLRLASLERAAGFDVASSSSTKSVHPLVWVAAGALAAFAVLKYTSKLPKAAKKASKPVTKKAPIVSPKRVVKHRVSR